MDFKKMLSFSRAELDALRLAMQEEHEAEVAALQALERVQRFLPTNPAAEPALNKANGVAHHEEPIKEAPAKTADEDEQIADVVDEPRPTLIGTVLATLKSRPNISFSNRTVLRAMEADGFPFTGDERRRLTSIHSALISLAERGQIRIVRRGSGREPNLYRAKIERTEETGSPVPGQAELTM
ncbi:MAG: hypothetical protein ABSG96_16365 [Terracidiphilus sp.]|jgi:hypothetical protein